MCRSLPPQLMLWKLKERRACRRGPKSAASTCRRVKTDQLHFRILRRSITSQRLSVWSIDGEAAFGRMSLEKLVKSGQQGHQAVPDKDLSRLSLCGHLPRCPLTPFYGRGRRYEDLPWEVNDLGGTWPVDLRSQVKPPGKKCFSWIEFYWNSLHLASIAQLQQPTSTSSVLRLELTMCLLPRRGSHRNAGIMHQSRRPALGVARPSRARQETERDAAGPRAPERQWCYLGLID